MTVIILLPSGLKVYFHKSHLFTEGLIRVSSGCSEKAFLGEEILNPTHYIFSILTFFHSQSSVASVALQKK